MIFKLKLLWLALLIYCWVSVARHIFRYAYRKQWNQPGVGYLDMSTNGTWTWTFFHHVHIIRRGQWLWQQLHISQRNGKWVWQQRWWVSWQLHIKRPVWDRSCQPPRLHHIRDCKYWPNSKVCVQGTLLDLSFGLSKRPYQPSGKGVYSRTTIAICKQRNSSNLH